MIIFALPDGVIDRLDRAMWLTPPFDVQLPPPRVVEGIDAIGAQPLGELNYVYAAGTTPTVRYRVTYDSSKRTVTYGSSIRFVKYRSSVIVAQYGANP